MPPVLPNATLAPTMAIRISAITMPLSVLVPVEPSPGTLCISLRRAGQWDSEPGTAPKKSRRLLPQPGGGG